MKRSSWEGAEKKTWVCVGIRDDVRERGSVESIFIKGLRFYLGYINFVSTRVPLSSSVIEFYFLFFYFFFQVGVSENK